jgi:hypothetical protein
MNHSGLWSADGVPGAAPLTISLHTQLLLLAMIGLVIFCGPLRRFFWRMVKLMIILAISILGAA